MSADQLRDEYRDGAKHKDNFHLLCITPELREPLEVREARSTSDIRAEQIKWMSWVFLREELLKVINESKLDHVSEGLVNELVDLLEAKGFVRFAGFERDNLFWMAKSQEALKSFFGRMARLVEELFAKLEEHQIINKRTSRAYFGRDGKTTNLYEPERWAHTFCTFAFADRNWDLGEFFFNYSTYLFVRFHLDRKDDPIWVGYGIGPWVYREKEWIGLGLSDDHKKRACEYLKSKPGMFTARTHTGTQSKTDYIIPIADIKPEHLEYNKERRIELFYKAPLDYIDKPELVEYLTDRLISLRDMVNEINLLPTEVMEEEGEEEVEEEEREGE